MNAEKIFLFKDAHRELKVQIPEVIFRNSYVYSNYFYIEIQIVFKVVDPQYGMFTWPAAPVLAQYLFVNRDQVKGKTVIEV